MFREAFWALVIGSLSMVFSTSEASAQAYCKLRDPVTQIKTLFPGSTDYRSIVRTVDSDARNAVAEALPFELHFNELGRHTLYVAQEGKRPVGLIHARSEEGRWGLVEIIWALDFDLRVQDFKFQRCRSPYRDVIESDTFKNLLKGKSLSSIRKLVSEDGKRLEIDSALLSGDARELGLAVVRSAMKTIVVTQRVWESDLRTLGLFYDAMGSFEEVASIDVVKDVYDATALAALEKGGFTDAGLGIEREAVEVFRVLDAENELIGLRVMTPWQYKDQRVLIWWTLTPEPKVLGIDPAGGWPTGSMDSAFNAVLGLTPAQISEECSSFAGLIACEVLIVADAHRN